LGFNIRAYPKATYNQQNFNGYQETEFKYYLIFNKMQVVTHNVLMVTALRLIVIKIHSFNVMEPVL